jgi:hypothetical protein
MTVLIDYTKGFFETTEGEGVGTNPATIGDVNFADVSLLLHGDGTSGSTTITDSSSNSVSMTVSGNTQIDTAVKKFGTGSIEFDGGNDQLTFTNTGFGTGDFTYEAWVYPDVQVQDFPAFFVVVDDASSSNRVTAQYDVDGQANKFRLNVGGTDIYSTAKSTGQWYHVAVVRSGTTVTFYLDGTSIGTATYSYDVPSHTGYIGGNTDRTSALSFKGYIDDLRITSGVARYTSNFTAPTAAFLDAGPTLDLSTGSVFTHTPSANVAYAFTNPPASGTASSATLKLTGANVVTGYDLANASYDSVSLSVSTQEADPRALFFKPDGTKMFVTGNSSDAIQEYSLSTAWDLSTASHTTSFSVASQEANPQGLFFKPDGTKFWITGNNDIVFQYSLTTAWDISTASYDSISFSTSGQAALPVGVAFKSDGTKMYIVDTQGTKNVYQYSLSNAWQVNSASYDSVSFSVSALDANIQDVTFNNDGTKMYIVGGDGNNIYQHSLSTAWDLSTASYDSISFSFSSQTLRSSGAFFKPDGTKLYVSCITNNAVYQYTTGSSALATITYPSSVVWSGGITPTTPANGETDVYTFYTDDGGTTYYGFQTGDALA